MVIELHQSSIASILSCPKRYYLRQQMEVQETSEEMYIGTRFHRAVESYFILRMDGINAAPQDIISGLKSSWGVVEDGKAVRWKSDPAGCLALTEKLVNAYLSWAAFQPGLDPEAVEQYLELNLGYCRLAGTLDLPLKSGKILDWKTAATTEHANKEAKTMIQPWMYCLLKANGDIDKATKIPFVYHFVTKHPVMIIPKEVYCRRADLEMFLYDLMPGVTKIIAEELWYVNPLSERCTPNQCLSWDQCRGSARA